MKPTDAKALVAVVVGTGALVGLGAAIVWHVATPSNMNPDREFGWYSYTPIRPAWFPTSLYLVGAGVLIASILASFLADSGLRIRSAAHRSRTGLFALLVVVGGALGFGAALAWEYWPPNPGDPGADVAALVPANGLYMAVGGIDTTGYTPLTSQWDDESAFDPVVEHPWLVFPLGGAAIAGAVALSLSIRDFRLLRHDSE
ncbi:hypothetical protein [Rhodococcoides yunnanense]|uniref:hypothetical protein n=1 Tax=Rhodococcoides yunnanense TaxID=278209 RepID=UPI000935082A|nr:hypothetical protein [Rhodococcus yunnanensis]